MGTTFGLSRYDAGIDRFVDVTLPAEVSSNITSLEFDGRGNLWVGTIDGLVTLDAITGEFEVYNTLNSEIVADVINSVTYDWFTGDIYIATSSGFSYVPSDIGQPVFDVEQVLAFPNPFVIDDAADRLNFNYGADARVRIFNAAGELVRAAITVAADVFLGAYADDIVWIHEQTKLVGEVEVCLVVGRCREQNAPAGVAGKRARRSLGCNRDPSSLRTRENQQEPNQTPRRVRMAAVSATDR